MVLGVMKRVLGAEHLIMLLAANNLATSLDEFAKPYLASCQRKL